MLPPYKAEIFSDWSKGGGQGMGPDHASLLPVSLETALKYCNYMFTTVFVLEAEEAGGILFQTLLQGP